MEDLREGGTGDVIASVFGEGEPATLVYTKILSDEAFARSIKDWVDSGKKLGLKGLEVDQKDPLYMFWDSIDNGNYPGKVLKGAPDLTPQQQKNAVYKEWVLKEKSLIQGATSAAGLLVGMVETSSVGGGASQATPTAQDVGGMASAPAQTTPSRPTWAAPTGASITSTRYHELSGGSQVRYQYDATTQMYWPKVSVSVGGSGSNPTPFTGGSAVSAGRPKWADPEFGPLTKEEYTASTNKKLYVYDSKTGKYWRDA
jgi:hypothetical protein